MTTQDILVSYTTPSNGYLFSDSAISITARAALLRDVASACLAASKVLTNREIRSTLYLVAIELRLGDDA